MSEYTINAHANELAETWLNGNRTDAVRRVREPRLSGDRLALAARVALLIHDYSPEDAERFAALLAEGIY